MAWQRIGYPSLDAVQRPQAADLGVELLNDTQAFVCCSLELLDHVETLSINLLELLVRSTKLLVGGVKFVSHCGLRGE